MSGAARVGGMSDDPALERSEKEELSKFKTLLNGAIAKADVAVTSSYCCREKIT